MTKSQELEKIISLKLSQLLIEDKLDANGYTKAKTLAQSISDWMDREGYVKLDEVEVDKDKIAIIISQEIEKWHIEPRGQVIPITVIVNAIATAQGIIKRK